MSLERTQQVQSHARRKPQRIDEGAVDPETHLIPVGHGIEMNVRSLFAHGVGKQCRRERQRARSFVALEWLRERLPEQPRAQRLVSPPARSGNGSWRRHGTRFTLPWAP